VTAQNGGGGSLVSGVSVADLAQDPSLVTSKDTSRVFEAVNIEEPADPSRPLLRILRCASESDARRNHIGT
jgi:hypothetical protein